MGIISETFRRRKGVLRSLHPTHPVLAFGKDAAWIVKDHEKCSFPCGEGTPFGKIRTLKGKVLLFDVPFGNFTFIHYIEDLIKNRIPIPVYNKELIPARVRNSLGEESVTPTYAFSEEARRLRNPAILERALARNGMVKAFRIGRTRLTLVVCENAIRCTTEILDSKSYFYETRDH
jgi:aminoglycoside 3-N-acetyltransferase